MKLAQRAGSTSARRALVGNSTSARRAGLMSWLSGHLNGVILQTFTKLLVERSTSWLDERSSSQLHRVNGVYMSHEQMHIMDRVVSEVLDICFH